MDPKEANAKFSARVNSFKQGAKALEEQAQTIRETVKQARRNLEELESSLEGGNNDEDSSETAKYELLQKRDQDMTGERMAWRGEERRGEGMSRVE